jgi:hypothetical protein
MLLYVRFFWIRHIVIIRSIIEEVVVSWWGLVRVHARSWIIFRGDLQKLLDADSKRTRKELTISVISPWQFGQTKTYSS